MSVQAMPSDMSFRMSRLGDMIISRKGIYVLNVIQRLFNMCPENDIYNSDGMGLDITTRAYRTYSDSTTVSRDTEYEQIIHDQISHYTDFIAHNIIAYRKKKILVVQMEIEYEGEIFQLQTSSDPKTLAAGISPKVIPGI